MLEDMDMIYVLYFLFMLVCSGGVKTKTVLDIIQYNNSMRQVSRYIGTHGLSAYFEQQNITAFLPTDRVFRTYHSSVYGYNMSDTVTVKSLFLYHLVGSKIRVSDIKDNTTAESLHPSGYRLYFNILMDGSTKIYSVNGAVLVSTDIIASNGIIHIIDRVIAPISSSKTLHDYLLKPDMPSLEFRSIAMASIIDMELKGNTNNSGFVFTAYAPNDSYLIPTMPEYAKDILYDVSNLEFLKRVVHAHTIPDYVQFLPSVGDITPRPSYMNSANLQIYRENGEMYVLCNRTRAKVISSNIPVSNGVLHVIDNLLCFKYRNLKQTIEYLQKTSAFAQYLNKSNQTLIANLQLTNHTYTIFVPVDEAFAKLPLQQQENLNNHADIRDMILKGHIIPNLDVDAETLGHNMKYTTLGQSSVEIIKVNEDIYIEAGGVRAKIIRRNIGATNGVVHLISNVLLMRNFTIFDVIEGNSQFTFMATYIKRHPDLRQLLSSQTKSLTVFLPGLMGVSYIPDYTLQNFNSNPVIMYEAIKGHIIENSRISSDNVTGHMRATSVSGKDIMIIHEDNDFRVIGNHIEAKVEVSDIWCSNGLLHIIDNLLQVPTRNIIDELSKHTDLMIMKNFLILMSDLKDTLKSENKQFTVLIPSDKAFDVIPRPRADILLSNRALLQNILMAHIMPNVNLLKADFYDGQTIKAQEEYIHVLRNQSKVYMVNNNIRASIIRGNIRGTNGVIHVIDRLLYYPYYSIADIMMKHAQLRPFYQLLSTNTEFKTMAETENSQMTVFAVSAKYMNSLSSEKLQFIRSDPNIVKQIYIGHTIQGSRLDSKFLRQHLLNMYNTTNHYNTRFTISNTSHGVTVDTGFENLRFDLDIVKTGTACTNGIVYLIQGFLNLSLKTVFDEMRFHNLLKYSLNQFLKLLPVHTEELFTDIQSKLTVFIPYEKAVQFLSQTDIKYINEELNNTEKTQLFHRHIVNGSMWKYKDLSKHSNLSREMEEQDVKLIRNIDGCYLQWNSIEAKILKSDILGSNGIVHIIDRYLFKAPDESIDTMTTDASHTKDNRPSSASINITSYSVLLLLFIFCIISSSYT